MSGIKKEENSENILLNYSLRKEYFVDKHLYFKNIYSQYSNKSHKSFGLLDKIYQSQDFRIKIKEQKIINDHYENTKKNMENSKTIEILKNGLFIYAKKMLLYCIKDKSIKSNSKNNNNKADLKNRDFVQESFVNFFFSPFQIMPLPNLLFNLDYKRSGKKIDNSINLFYDWDGCYLLEDSKNKNDVTFKTGYILPLCKEMKYKITQNKKTEQINNNISIKNISIIFIEVKTHFQNEKEENRNNNFENIIKVMFLKLNYFMNLYSKILQKSVKEIIIILIYEQNNLINYHKNIDEFIDKYKNDFLLMKDYEIYFEIHYLIPYIKNITLNGINQKLLELNIRIKKLEEVYNIKKEYENIENEQKNIKKEIKLIKLKLGLEEDKSDGNISENSSIIIKEDNKIYSNIIKKDEDKNKINKNISKINIYKTITPLKKKTAMQTKNIQKIKMKKKLKNNISSDNNKKKVKHIRKKKVSILDDNVSENATFTKKEGITKK